MSNRRKAGKYLLGSALLAALTLTAGHASAAPFGPSPSPNPALGPVGTATQHGDSEASDTTPYRGPGNRPVTSQFNSMGANCASILIGSDELPQALCAAPPTLAPVVHLLDPETGASLASLSLPAGGLFSGVYGYLDNADRMVLVDGDRNLQRVGHDRGGEDGAWRLFLSESTPIGDAVDSHCDGPRCDTVIAPIADHTGKVWFATQNATIGVVDTDTGISNTLSLGAGESVANSISTSPLGMSVATSHALYMLDTDNNGAPKVLWRKEYDRGPGRKPGQLSWGTGASPTFFGPRHGTEYLTITDNAVPTENLLVYKAASGELVCSIPAINGTEDAPIGSGNSVFVASSYGYSYRALPPGAGPSVPTSADFTGGMTRIDINPLGSGCEQKWTNDVRSTAVPKLSTADGKIYTVSQSPGTDPSDHQYSYTVVDAQTGAVETTQLLGTGPTSNTNQLAGNIARDGTVYQGTLTGLFRIAPTGEPTSGSSSGSSSGPMFGSAS